MKIMIVCRRESEPFSDTILRLYHKTRRIRSGGNALVGKKGAVIRWDLFVNLSSSTAFLAARADGVGAGASEVWALLEVGEVWAALVFRSVRFGFSKPCLFLSFLRRAVKSSSSAGSLECYRARPPFFPCIVTQAIQYGGCATPKTARYCGRPGQFLPKKESKHNPKKQYANSTSISHRFNRL